MSPMFDKVIMKYHNVDVNVNKAAEEKYEKVTLPALPEGAIASTRIRTARNVKSLPFTVNMTKKVFAGFDNKYLKGTYHPMVGMPEADRVKYIDLHYLYINDDPTLELVGCYDDWPSGRGIFINDNQDKGVFIVWVGEEDQLRIMAMAKESKNSVMTLSLMKHEVIFLLAQRILVLECVPPSTSTFQDSQQNNL